LRKKTLSLVIIYCIIITSVSMCFLGDIPVVNGIDPYFTLTARIDGNNPRFMDYMSLVKQYLARIGINVDIVVNNPNLPNSITETTDFDICYFEYENENNLVDPDFSKYYSENGTNNIFGYHTYMDYRPSTGGLNEYYLNQGKQMFPPNSLERIENYQKWEGYLNANITPCLPAFSPNEFTVNWAGLDGYNISKGLLQSFGDMSWSATHIEQENSEELVISDNAWITLNPLFQTDGASQFISRAILDPLIWFDSDSSCWPHLASSINLLNDTHIRIKSRQGIMWQSDSDELFTSEYFDVEDIYFSLYAWKHLSNKQSDYQWIEKMEIINNTVIDIFIDENPETTENEPYINFLESLAAITILPEHYLNQTQLADGITPDIAHSSWEKFSQQCFGTGMFKLGDFILNKETVLILSPMYWGLNDIVVNDEIMNFRERFGTFENCLEQIKIKVIKYDEWVLNEFESGTIDIIEKLDYSQLKTVQVTDSIIVQDKPSNKMGMFGFNLRPSRMIGDGSESPGFPSMTVGQALRNAICYAIDLVEINDVVHSGNYYINQHYLPVNLKMWWYPYEDYIYRDNYYKHDLDLARHYMGIAGYEVNRYYFPDSPNFIAILGFFIIVILPIGLCIFITALIIKAVLYLNEDSEKPSNQVKKPKFYCYYCNKIIEKDTIICPKCDNTIPHCIVCSLPITQKSIIGKCIHCEKIAHLTHLQEWMKVKGYCPNCSMHLREADIIIEGYN